MVEKIDKVSQFRKRLIGATLNCKNAFQGVFILRKRKYALGALLLFGLGLTCILIITGLMLNNSVKSILGPKTPLCPKVLPPPPRNEDEDDGEEIVEKPSDPMALNWGTPVVLDPPVLLGEANPRAAGLSKQLESKLLHAFTFRDTMRSYLTKEDGESPQRPIRVKVIGDKDIIDRDFPLIKKGYSTASPSFTYTIVPGARYNESDPNYDLVLCLSLTTCTSPKYDVFKDYLTTNPGMRVNRAPKLKGVLWLKHNYCKTIPDWLATEIAFQCWVLPDQMKPMMQHVRTRDPKDKWIVKPWSGGGGDGIKVVTGPCELKEHVERRDNYFVVQPFLVDPLLINDRKLDLRVYVLLTSTYPFRGYIHERGLVRFAAQAYSAKSSFSQSRFLTNTSINKKESNATMAELTWPFTMLYEALGETRARRTRLGMDRAIALLLLAAEFKFPRNAGCERADGACYHLLGFDVMLPSKEALPKIIEVNGEPSFVMATTRNPGDAGHYDETKIVVARDIAKMVFSPLTPKSKQEATQLVQEINDPSFVAYAVELTREQQVVTEFRPCYPSPVAAVYEAADVSFIRLLSTAKNAHARLKLHHALKKWELGRLVQCSHDPKCSKGGLKSVLSDLVDEGLRIPSANE